MFAYIQDSIDPLVTSVSASVILMTVVFVLGVIVVFKYFETSVERARHAPPIPPETMLPPQPRLEPVPGKVRRQVTEEERARIAHGWDSYYRLKDKYLKSSGQ